MGHEEVEAKTPPPLDSTGYKLMFSTIGPGWGGGVRGNFCHFCQYFAHCLTKS
jgi:hypothetical protein